MMMMMMMMMIWWVYDYDIYNIYIMYIYIHTNTHTHTYIGLYIALLYWAHSPLVSNVPSLSRLMGMTHGILCYRPRWCPSPSPFRLFPLALQIPVFFHWLFFNCHWISIVFLLYDWCICTHSVDHSLTHFLGTLCSTPRGGTEVRMKQKSRLKCLPWPGFEHQTLQHNGREYYH